MFLHWAWHSFCWAHRFALTGHISTTLSTSAIQCNWLCPVSRIMTKVLSVCIESNAWSWPANIPWLDLATCLATTFSWGVSPVVVDCIQLIKSWTSEWLASTPAQCGLIENEMSATLEWLAHIEGISSSSSHLSVISGIHNLKRLSLRLE